jgi:hypothetical protein
LTNNLVLDDHTDGSDDKGLHRGSISAEKKVFTGHQYRSENKLFRDKNNLVKKDEFQIRSLQISSFPRNSSSQLQPPYFRLCKQRLLTMLSQLVMLKKDKLFLRLLKAYKASAKF